MLVEDEVSSDADYDPPQPAAPFVTKTQDSSTAVYFASDSWLWQAFPNRRRICWIPLLQYIFWRPMMSTYGNMVAFWTSDGRLVIIDVSAS